MRSAISRSTSSGSTSRLRQEWGVASFAGMDAEGRRLELAVYGRDAADAQWLRKVWRFCIYRDSGPTLVLNRLQQVEHEAYLTFLADHAGTQVPRGRGGGTLRSGPRRRPRHPVARRDPVLAIEGGRASATTTSTAILRAVLLLARVRYLARRTQPRDRPGHAAGPGAPRLPARLVVGPCHADRRRPGCGRGGRRGGGRHRPCRGLHLSGARHRDDPGRPHPPAALHARPRDRSHGPVAEGLPQDVAREPRRPPPGSRSRNWSKRSASAGPIC